MLTLNLIYVGRSVGEFEGRAYDSVALSDGIRTYKFKNPGGVDVTTLKEEETRVNCEFKIAAGQNGTAVLKLASWSKVK